MNKLFLFLSILFYTTTYSQSPEGKWYGELNVYGNKLPLEFSLTKNKKQWTGEMLSPNQSDVPLKLINIEFKKQQLSFETETNGASYAGELIASEIKGKFTQNGLSFPLVLSKKQPQSTRPQTPKEPFKYLSEDIVFKNRKAKITLAGTFTRPNNNDEKYPVVVLISGSGPQDRNSNILGHKSFMVIADELSSNGIAVLRFDDRGTALSEGDFSAATSFDFADDVEAAVDYLKSRNDIDTNKIGLIGHSEGGIIAPLVASKRKDIGYMVLMAAPGVKGSNILLRQQELILSQSGLDKMELESIKKINVAAYRIVKSSPTLDLQKDSLLSFFRTSFDDFPKVLLGNTMDRESFARAQTEQLSTPWMRNFILYNPKDALKKVSCPVLAINGTKDLQVDANQNLKTIANTLNEAGNESVTTRLFADHNHLFQECKTGMPSEYGQLEQTISHEVLHSMLDWITHITNSNK